MLIFVQAAASKSQFIELVQVYFRRGQYLFYLQQYGFALSHLQACSKTGEYDT